MKKILLIVFSRAAFAPLLFCLCLLGSRHSNGQAFTSYAVFSDSARIAGSLCGDYFLSGIDTAATQEIELRAGDAQNDSLSFVQVIAFDAGSPPSGFSYARSGDQITIGVIAAVPLLTYYCSVRIKAGNTWSAPFRFITN